MTTSNASPARVVESGTTVRPARAQRVWLLVACCAIIVVGVVLAVGQYFGPRNSAPIMAAGYLGWDDEQSLDDNGDPGIAAAMKPGQEQSFTMAIVNNGSYPQTVSTDGGQLIYRITVSATAVPELSIGVAPPASIVYLDTVTVQPGEYRWLKVTATKAATCMPYGRGSALGIGTPSIVERSGWATRTETIAAAEQMWLRATSDLPGC